MSRIANKGIDKIIKSLPKCEVRYGPTLAQHRQKFAEDRLPISCRCWNNNSGMHLAANSGPNSGCQHFFSAQQRANAVPNSGFLSSGMVCRGKSDTWPSNVPSAQHLTDANSDTGPLTIADSWLPRLGQYCCRIITFVNSHLGISNHCLLNLKTKSGSII